MRPERSGSSSNKTEKEQTSGRRKNKNAWYYYG